jgi:DNA-binding MarR family transcriptional regulator
MTKRQSRKRITETMRQLTPLQLADLVLFQHHKKWTVHLMAMQLDADQSTANRRLRSLMAAGMLGRRPGGFRSTGGRRSDLYCLTPLGARVLSRHLQLGGNYLTAPNVANEANNDHDLFVLELAIRLGQWDKMRHRERMTFDRYEPLSPSNWHAGFKPTDEQFVLVPDLMLPDHEFAHEKGYTYGIYIEVEQTTRYQHIERKRDTYRLLTLNYRAQGLTSPVLYIVFGDEQQQRALLPEHLRAWRENTTSLSYVHYTNMDLIRHKEVRSIDDLDAKALVNEDDLWLMGY